MMVTESEWKILLIIIGDNLMWCCFEDVVQLAHDLAWILICKFWTEFILNIIIVIIIFIFFLRCAPF